MNIIKNIRNKYKFTQEELATYIGVSYTTINRWELEKAHPSKKHQVTLNNLFNGSSNYNDNLEEESLRPIQYLGSKKKLLNEILNTINTLVQPNSTVCDLFSGSGVVSSALSKQHKVISIDIQKYSSVLVQSLVTNTKSTKNYINNFIDELQIDTETNKILETFLPLIEYEEICIKKAKDGNGMPLAGFIENCSVYKYLHSKEIKKNPINKHLSKVKDNIEKLDISLKNRLLVGIYYGGIYFSFKQAVLMDAILNKSQYLNDVKIQNEILSILLSTASHIVNTVGKQFAQPIKLTDAKGKIKKLLLERTIRDRQLSVLETFINWHSKYSSKNTPLEHEHEFFHLDYEDFLKNYKNNIDCFYADPPYTIDHYSRFYHVLETMSLYDFPKIDTKTRNGIKEYVRGMYRDDRHQSPFSISTKVENAFKTLFKGVSSFSAPLVLSYSPSNLDKNGRPRLLELSRIKALAKEYFSFVYLIEPKKHSHRKLNANHRNVEIFDNAEVFIVCTYKEVKKWKNI